MPNRFNRPSGPGYTPAMIIGTHFLLYSKNPEADRAFFRDVLKFPFVDAGEGWLIFAMSPAEAGIHPMDGDFTEVETAGWGRVTTIPLPSGCRIGLYQPRHATALNLRAK